MKKSLAKLYISLALLFFQTDFKLIATDIPDVIIVIKKHAVEVDMITITMLNPKFSASALYDIVNKIGYACNEEPRGSRVYYEVLKENNSNLKFLKASFALNNIIDNKKNILRISPFLKGLAGITKPYTLKNIIIHFIDQKPTQKTLRHFKSSAVELTGNFYKDPAGIEYMINLKSQDPIKLNVPEHYPLKTYIKEINNPLNSNIPIWKIIFVIIGALSIGMLIYIFLAKTIWNAAQASEE